MPAILALTAACFWGIGDFILGSQARRSSVLAVALIAQLSGLAAIVVFVAIRGTPPPPQETLLVGIATGALGALVFYGIITALAMGNMARVAPAFGTATVIPVVVGLAGGESPSTMQMAGIGVAIAGVMLVSTERAVEEEHRGHGSTRKALLIALLSAAGAGTVLVGIHQTSDYDPFWAILLFRVTGVLLLGGAAAIAAATGRWRLGLMELSLLPLVMFGVLDTLANALWAIASTTGLLSVVAVLGGIFPAFTVVLAVIFLKEPLDWVQGVGVATTLTGTALITAG